MWCPTKNVGPIGSAILTFLLDTNKQTDKPNLYIDFHVSRVFHPLKMNCFPNSAKETTKQCCLNSAQAYHTFYGANLFTKRGMAKINA